MGDNLFSEVVEGVSGGAKQVVKNTAKKMIKTPLDVISTAAEQISGKSGGSNQQQDATFQQQLSNLKQQDAQDTEFQKAAIRRNLQELMTPKRQIEEKDQELPMNMRGMNVTTVGDLEEDQEKAKKKQEEIEKKVDFNVHRQQGSAERNRIVG